MPQQPDSPKNNLKAIRILFYALITGVLLMSAIIIGVNGIRDKDTYSIKGSENIFLAIAAGLAIVCFLTARSGYNKGIIPIKDPLISLIGKLNQYRAALIRYLALCEMPAIFAAILFFMSGDYLFLVITAAMLVAMLSKSPTLERLVTDLDLSSQEEQELE
jgi:hypothetical protein